MNLNDQGLHAGPSARGAPYTRRTSHVLSFRPLPSTFIHYHPRLSTFTFCGCLCVQRFLPVLCMFEQLRNHTYTLHLLCRRCHPFIFSRRSQECKVITLSTSLVFSFGRGKDKISQSVFIKVTFQPKVKICS